MARLPTLFISHGGGPWPYIPEMRAAFAKTADWLQRLPSTLPEKPLAVLSVSGHWEASAFAVSSADRPPMIFDYSGFPPHTYQISYPAPGAPRVAARVRDLLNGAGMDCTVDPAHGLDHGTFVPLALMYPDADVPVISMSIKRGYDPAEHFKMGAALGALRDEGVLIIGSGLSYHNMRGFGSASSTPVSKQFGDWLGRAIAQPALDRQRSLLDWESAPAARAAHPREDHLIPLMVVAGAAGDDAGRVDFVDHVMSVDMASYRFG